MASTIEKPKSKVSKKITDIFKRKKGKMKEGESETFRTDSLPREQQFGKDLLTI